ARNSHAMVYDSARGGTLLFGGYAGVFGSPDLFDETWMWNGSDWTRLDVAGPSARHSHAMAYDSARAVTVLFGGNHWMHELPVFDGETWEWDGIAWTQRTVAGPSPSPRHNHTMAYDAARGVTVLFGGYTEAGY